MEGCSDPEGEARACAGGADATPWYGMYRDEFLRMLAFGDHEAMDHPVACEHAGAAAAGLAGFGSL